MRNSAIYSKALFVFLLLVILLSILFRFVWLEYFPVGMYHDEIEYVLSAKRYALEGVDLSGYRFPLSLFKTETDGIISPVAPLLLAPLTYFVKLDQASARIPFVLINILTAGVLGWIVYQLSRQRLTALISIMVFLLNPWSIYLSRYAADSPLALFFYLVGTLILLKVRGWWLMFALVMFVAGFFSYHGAKLLFLPLIGIVLIYRLFDYRSITQKQAVFFFAGSAIVFGLFVTVSFFIPNSIVTSRSDDLIFNRVAEITRIVDEKRRLSVENPLTSIMINKVTVVSGIFFEKYISSFSPDVLFLHGDYRSTYRFADHGLFYPLDWILIFLGFLCLYKSDRKKFFFLGAILGLSPVSTSISAVETSVVHRGFMILPILVIVQSLGMFEMVNFLRKPILGKFILVGIIFSYLFFVAGFLNFYFWRFPVMSQESYFLSERLLTRFLNIDVEQKTQVILSEPKIARSVYLEYLFYSNLDQHALQNGFVKLDKRDFNFKNLEFLYNCPKTLNPQITYVLSRDLGFCQLSEKPRYRITDQKDAGAIFQIYNSDNCEGQSLESYKSDNSIKNYNIESLHDSEFCKVWINSP